MRGISPSNPYLTNNLLPPPPRSFRYRQWQARGYQAALQPMSSDSEMGVLVGQMGWMGSQAHARGYLWGTAGNMGALLSEAIDLRCLVPRDQSPRYSLPAAITVKQLAGRRVLITKSGSRLDAIAVEHPALNLTIVEIDDDGRHYRMRYGTPPVSILEQGQITAPKPTSELFHYLLIFDQLENHGFKALVHLQPKFLNLISRSEYGSPSRFYDFLRGYEPETPIIYEKSGGIGFVQEKAPGIPELSYENLRLFKKEDLPSNQRHEMRHILCWVGHGTFSRGADILDAYKHAEYFEAAAQMAWEANQKRINAQAYNKDIIDCILREFRQNQSPPQEHHNEDENLYNYP
ncbi:MAG: class II aldolase/adducin family protein [Candidatus Poribacteria bacterium]|nr:class II aldolase/adducin family protein [Candidatus Poribacteria bacterium]